MYDVVIIGSGSAGFSAAEAAKALGASVCMIEKEKLGGECPNFACVPTKAAIRAAKVHKTMKHARDYGITAPQINVDFAKVMEYPRKVVKTITGGGEVGDRYIQIAKKLKVTIELGAAEFVDDHTVLVDKGDGLGKKVQGKTFILATGSTSFIPPIEGIQETHYQTFKTIWDIKTLPKSIGIIGGGPVGCEFATFFSEFGSTVSLIQSAPFILHREEEAISKLAEEAMIKRGVDVFTNTRTTQLINGRGGVYGIELSQNNQKTTLAVDMVLIATGKRAALDGLKVDKTGIALDERKNIRANKEARTSMRHIFAAGDVSGGYMFTHTAHHEGEVAGHNAACLAMRKRCKLKKIDTHVVPRATFVDPEVASVGMTTNEAKEKFKKILVGEFKVGGLGRAVTEGEQFGLIRIVADAKTGKVVGGSMIGHSAAEVIHEVALAIYLKAKMDHLAQMIHAFPTFSEAVTAAASNVTKM